MKAIGARAALVDGRAGWASNLPWIDGIAALSGGILVLALRGALAGLYGVSERFLTTIAFVNLLYSVCGITLGMLRRRPAQLLTALVSANGVWAAVCFILAIRVPASVTFWGHGHLVGEGAFVAALAVLEWRYRRQILEPRSAA